MKYSSGFLFKNRVLKISFLITSIFSLTIFILIYKTEQNNFINTKNDFEKFLQLSIKQTIQDSITNYRILADTVLESTQAKKLMFTKDRDALYKQTSPMWDLWSKLNPDLNIMLFHKYDGTAFLRMHKPEKFDDYLSDIRPMVKAAHEQKKVLTGYETGKYSTVFRVLTPIWYEKEYLGTLDFGINPNYFIKKIYELTGHQGLLFVKKKYLKLFQRDSAFAFDDYVLQSSLDKKLQNMLEEIPKDYNLNENMQWEHDGRQYILHTEKMKDFQGNTQAKLLFFYDITKLIDDQNYFITILISMMLAFWVSMFFLLNNSFNTLLNHLKILHEEHTHEIQKKDDLMIAQSRQAAMGEMLSMIAHQWRQPLTVIGMHTINMTIESKLDQFSQESVAKHIDGINVQIEHLSQTINNFRDFFQPDKVKEHTTVQRSIDMALKIIDPSIDNANITIINDFQSRSELYTFPHELMQVLLILLHNAKDAIIDREIEKGKIYIKTYEDHQNVVISICDNAQGIAREHYEKIFNPYFSTKGKNGTGLGLYMSKIIITKHLNGEIFFENTVNGVCFYITLPLQGKA